VRAVISHRTRSTVAHALMTQLTRRFGKELAVAPAPGLDRLFPTPVALADADLGSVGLTPASAHTVRTVARAMVDGRVDFNPDRTLEDFVARWTALPGIGAWTAHYLALRALGHPDAFPVNDLVLSGTSSPNGIRLGGRSVCAAAEAWRPWRGYAAIHLWNHSGAA